METLEEKKGKKFDMDAFYNIKNEVAELENRKIIRPRHLTEKLPIVKAHLSIRANNLLVSLNKSPMNMTEVAQQTALQKANATKYIDKMISKGFVYRFQKEKDRRNIYIGLTPLGKELVENTFEMLHGNLEEQLDKHTTEEEAPQGAAACVCFFPFCQAAVVSSKTTSTETSSSTAKR